VGFQVLAAASMKMTIFWNIMPCSLIEIYRRFKDACLLIALMMEAASTSETLVNFYQTTRRNIPEDSHLHFVYYLIYVTPPFFSFKGLVPVAYY
jgi:hypothetical protein